MPSSRYARLWSRGESESATAARRCRRGRSPPAAREGRSRRPAGRGRAARGARLAAGQGAVDDRSPQPWSDKAGPDAGGAGGEGRHVPAFEERRAGGAARAPRPAGPPRSPACRAGPGWRPSPRTAPRGRRAASPGRARRGSGARAGAPRGGQAPGPGRPRGRSRERGRAVPPPGRAARRATSGPTARRPLPPHSAGCRSGRRRSRRRARRGRPRPDRPPGRPAPRATRRRPAALRSRRASGAASRWRRAGPVAAPLVSPRASLEGSLGSGESNGIRAHSYPQGLRQTCQGWAAACFRRVSSARPIGSS